MLITDPDSKPASTRIPGRSGNSRVLQPAGHRDEPRCNIFRVQADLDRVAVRRDIQHLARQRLTRRDQKLGAHQVDAGDQFGDRVFDLQAGVDLEEVERPVRRHDELDGARALVASACPAATAAWPNFSRNPASTAVDGASSMIFW